MSLTSLLLETYFLGGTVPATVPLGLLGGVVTGYFGKKISTSLYANTVLGIMEDVPVAVTTGFPPSSNLHPPSITLALRPSSAIITVSFTSPAVLPHHASPTTTTTAITTTTTTTSTTTTSSPSRFLLQTVRASIKAVKTALLSFFKSSPFATFITAPFPLPTIGPSDPTFTQAPVKRIVAKFFDPLLIPCLPSASSLFEAEMIEVEEPTCSTNRTLAALDSDDDNDIHQEARAQWMPLSQVYLSMLLQLLPRRRSPFYLLVPLGAVYLFFHRLFGLHVIMALGISTTTLIAPTIIAITTTTKDEDASIEAPVDAQALDFTSTSECEIRLEKQDSKKTDTDQDGRITTGEDIQRTATNHQDSIATTTLIATTITATKDEDASLEAPVDAQAQGLTSISEIESGEFEGEDEFVDAEDELDEGGDAFYEQQSTLVDANEEAQAASAEIEVIIETEVEVEDITLCELDTTSEMTATVSETSKIAEITTPVFAIAETDDADDVPTPIIDDTNTYQVNIVSIPDKEDAKASETISAMNISSTGFAVTSQGEDDADDNDGFQVVSYKKRTRRTVPPATHKVLISIPADANTLSNPAKAPPTPTKTDPARKHSAPAATATTALSSPISWASIAVKAASTAKKEESRREVRLSEERSSSLLSIPSSDDNSQRLSPSSCSTTLSSSSSSSSSSSKRTSTFSWADDDWDMDDFDLGDWKEGVSSSGSESVLFSESEENTTLVEDSSLALPEVCHLHDLEKYFKDKRAARHVEVASIPNAPAKDTERDLIEDQSELLPAVCDLAGLDTYIKNKRALGCEPPCPVDIISEEPAVVVAVDRCPRKEIKEEEYHHGLPPVCDFAQLEHYFNTQPAASSSSTVHHVHPSLPLKPTWLNLPDIAKADLEAAPMTTVRFMNGSVWRVLEGADEEREGELQEESPLPMQDEFPSLLLRSTTSVTSRIGKSVGITTAAEGKVRSFSDISSGTATTTATTNVTTSPSTTITTSRKPKLVQLRRDVQGVMSSFIPPAHRVPAATGA
ncbi:hypothetical protein BDQ12DRAFT_739236 [Crucibulum laeve]|uniref:Uncharacterized protein n=1 Tax=Crucibulum laeve TaxID=68775 RepID=A0A5C3LVF4_9AGAR|nr:hypothetical protein BDQ12DRAFT_739236 [Crucibulum laeve]